MSSAMTTGQRLTTRMTMPTITRMITGGGCTIIARTPATKASRRPNQTSETGRGSARRGGQGCAAAGEFGLDLGQARAELADVEPLGEATAKDAAE